jgi:hypothetical protein
MYAEPSILKGIENKLNYICERSILCLICHTVLFNCKIKNNSLINAAQAAQQAPTVFQ